MNLAGVISLNNAMQMGAFRLPHLVLGSAFGPAALGHFAMAERVVAMPTQVVSTAVGDVFRQRASARYLSDGDFSTLAERTLLTMGALAIIPFAIAIVLAPWAFTVLLGPDWTASGHVAQILLIGEIFGFVVNPIAPTAIIVSANRYLFFWALSRLALMGILAALVAMHVLTLFQFLWLFVAVRVLMVSTDGAFCYRYSRASPVRA
jgi:O-antigen/teichoic acid export membrane protein